MSDLSFGQLFEEAEKTRKASVHMGEVLDGTVIEVREDQIILNIDYKSDAIITRNEYTSTPGVDLRTVVKEGDVITAKVIKTNDGDGFVALSVKRLAAELGSKKLEEAFENKTVLTAKVAQVLDGGLSVVIDETKVFIPASLVSDTYEKDLSKYAGQEIEFVITEFNPRKRRIIGDRKQLLVAKKAKMREEVMSKIAVGQVVTGTGKNGKGDTIEGTVKNVTDFGVFIDIGGVDGLLHVSEISWGRIENPKKKFKPGDEVKAYIKDINNDKIALSLKFDNENPWINVAEKYPVGSVVKGKVARMTDFGAFVELEEGVDALLHVSQIAKQHIEKPAEVLKIGQEIEAKVVDLNADEHKISLSIKALLADEEDNQEEETTEE